MTTRVHRGLAGSQAFLRSFRHDTPSDRILLVCRPTSFRQSGAEDWLGDALGMLPPVFSDFSSNPKVEEAEKGVARFRSLGAEAILAIGGGSVMDLAKLINILGTRNVSLEDYLADPSPCPAPLKPMLAVPTTAGSGSEATRFAVVYRGVVKYSVSDLALRPGHVLLVPEFTASATSYQTACSGLDALAQAIESHWAREATRESRGYACKAIQLALRHLSPVVHHPTLSDRTAMLEAAHLAGKAIDFSKTTGPHAFSYVLTSVYGLPHGQAVGLLLPFFVQLHQQAGIQLDGIDEHRIRNVLVEIGLDRKLPARADELVGLMTRHVNMERLENNPVPVSEAFIREMAAGLAGKP